jgi:hypothetical protein
MDYVDLMVELEIGFDGTVFGEKFTTDDNQTVVIMEKRCTDEDGNKYIEIDAAIAATEEEACAQISSFGKKDFEFTSTGNGSVQGLRMVLNYILDNAWWWDRSGYKYVYVAAPDAKRARAYRRLERYGFIEVDRYEYEDGDLWVEWIKPL